MKCGWCGMTIEASHPESGKVIRPPSPGVFPVNSRIMRGRSAPCAVAVKETHFDSSMWLAKTPGCPKAGRPAASFFHKAQAPPVSRTWRAGAEVMEPRLDDSVIDPSVTGPTGVSRVTPPDWRRIAETRVVPPVSINSRSVTRVFISNTTPCPASQAGNGRTIESYWL